MQVDATDTQTIFIRTHGSSILKLVFDAFALLFATTLLAWFFFWAAGSLIDRCMVREETLRFDYSSRTLRYEKSYLIPLLDRRWEVPASDLASVELTEPGGESTHWTVQIKAGEGTHQLYRGSSQADAKRLALTLVQLTGVDLVRHVTG